MQKFALGIVQNPYATICCVPLTDDGMVDWRRISTWTGKWNANGEPIVRGTHCVVSTINPHSSGGAFSAISVGMVDATPRSLTEAYAIASRCPQGNHVDDPLTDETAKVAIAAAIAALGVPVGELVDRK